MKLLVFAHKPPPHHGQSYMVQLMLDGLGGDHRHSRTAPAPDRELRLSGKNGQIKCYHVDCRLSREISDIGRMRFGKFFLVLKYCLEALWCRFRYGVRNFYYVPAPGQRAPLYRDWLVMALCRPFFRRTIFHTHAVGLGAWLDEQARPWEKSISRALMSGADLNIVLSEHYRADVSKLAPKAIQVAPIGIPDPCPDFEAAVLPRRLARSAARQKLLAGDSLQDVEQAGDQPQIFRVLYVSICSREKGLFDLVEGVALAHAELSGSPIQLRVAVVGKFFLESERKEFEERIAGKDLQFKSERIVQYHGFVDTATKYRLLRESDCFCFPTYYQAEGQPASLVEAMAFGLPIITSRWRAIPELFPKDYSGLVNPRSPREIAAALQTFLREYRAQAFRARFLEKYTSTQYVERMRIALRDLEKRS